MIAIREARIDDLQGDGRAARDAIIVGIEAARGELVAGAAGAPAVWLASAVQGALEKLLVDGAIVHAGATRPFPIILAAITGAALKAVVLAEKHVSDDPPAMIGQDLRK